MVALYLLGTQTASVEVWTAGTGVPIHQHMTQFLPAKPFYWGVSRVFGLYHHKNIQGGVGAEWQQLKLGPSLSQVCCPYSVDKLSQLWCYFKWSPCCPWCPAGFKAEAVGAALPQEFI